jgi:hypothetical protein
MFDRSWTKPRQIQDWCPLLRAKEDHDSDVVNPSIQKIRDTLWKRLDSMTHRRAKLPLLSGKVPGWSQIVLRRTMDRIGNPPQCLEESRKKVLQAAAAFDRKLILISDVP